MKRYTEEFDDGMMSSYYSILTMAKNAADGRNTKVVSESFIGWMKRNIGTSISDIKDWFISAGSAISNTAGKIATAFANIGTAIAQAISSTKAYIVALFQKTPSILATPVFGITYGKLLAIATISTAVIFVMYKIYKAIKKRNSDSVSEVAAAKGDLRRIKKSINESITFFSNMNYILREDAPDANGITGSASINMIAKADGPAREMVDWIAKKTVNEGDEKSSSIGNFLKRNWSFIMIIGAAACAIFITLSNASHIITLGNSTSQIANTITGSINSYAQFK